MVQKSRQLELPLEGRGEAPRTKRSGQASLATFGTASPGTGSLMEEALSRPNLKRAWKRVKRNGGSPGIDGMTVDAFWDWLWEHWPRIRERLLAGTYRPQSVLGVEIPKRGGGVRKLGIPAVLDRFIQQALLQILQSRFDPSFSEHSHGFRPGRRAHDAIREARQYVQGGKRWVVGVDLEKFFDRINHDVLMGRLAKRIDDRRVLRLIRRYLEAGVMADGVMLERRICIRVSHEALGVMKARVRQLTQRTRGRSLSTIIEELRAYLLGWKGYFLLADTPGIFCGLDEWIRHRLRAHQLKQWKRGRTVFRELRARGLSKDVAARVAAGARRWWWNSSKLLNAALPNSYLAGPGLPSLGP